VLAVTGCAPDGHERFLRWYALHGSAVEAYRGYLDRQGVARVVPLEQLLHTGRDWRRCGEEFAVPPQALWPTIVPTLRLLARLRAEGALPGAVRVASGWRDPRMNHCVGGSARSKHLTNAAIDLDWQAPPGAMAALCAKWRSDGPRLDWGLGFYSPTRLHFDTWGHRTWGHDYHRATSLCVAPP
jgi:uncharacterized protein YcbK (DUF882 family)